MSTSSRCLLLPGGINESVVDRTLKQPQWKAIMPPDVSYLQYILICSWASPKQRDLEFHKNMFQRLLPGVSLDVRMWTMGDKEFNSHMERCNIFYMMGGEPQAFQTLFQQHGDSMRILSAAVKTGRVLYIGGCGGSSIAGMYYVPFQQEMMSFVPGLVMIADNEVQGAEAQKRLESIAWQNPDLAKLPRFMLTKQVAMMICDAGVHGFVVKKSRQIRPPCGVHPRGGQAGGVPASQPTTSL